MQKVSSHLASGSQIASAVVLQVDNQLLHAFFGKFGGSLAHFGGSFLGKAAHGNVAGLVVDHICLVDAVQGYVVAGHHKLKQLGVVASHYHQAYFRAFFAAQGLQNL